ncbi:MAG TPA: hypothetical protein VGD72_12685 [Mycobacteriales bacterium]|jgi:hypothetical protein
MREDNTRLRRGAVLGSGLVLAAGVLLTGGPADAASHQHVERGVVPTISYAPNSYVIGNAYPGWSMFVQGPRQFAKGPGNPRGAYYRWGFLGGNLRRCAWIEDGNTTGGTTVADRCGSPQQIDTPYFLRTFTDGTKNNNAGDGSRTHMNRGAAGCTSHTAFGNVSPWAVPARPADPVSDVPDGKALLWRYVSRDGRWVMVRDPAPTAGKPNWYFVPRGCVSLADPN